MAKSNVLQPFILSWEGGFVNDPADAGGATNKGVTIGTFRQVFGKDKTVADLKAMTSVQWHTIFKRYYWDKWKADHIIDQSVANMVVDWVWASGQNGITNVQKLLGVAADGVVGQKTLDALNKQDSRQLFHKIYEARKAYYDRIIQASVTKFERRIGRKATQAEKLRYTNERFRKGWMRRLDGIQYGSLIYNNGSRVKC